ncbi:MAG: cation transporter [Flavobacteriaceae bacterium]|nr:cation transporter [Flavobacteriaceae bacterium]
MKKTILSIVIALVTIISTNAQSKESKTTDVTFGVRGNCGMCKATIEKAVNGLDGVAKATWSGDKKEIDISYDDKKVNIMEIHTAIANTGYDTDMSTGNDTAYENLPGCCQYDRKMKMSLKEKKEDHSGHKH